jgi:hypothetical protein
LAPAFLAFGRADAFFAAGFAAPLAARVDPDADRAGVRGGADG